jgi:hypothetical protein
MKEAVKMLVVRYGTGIQADIERGWSAWMNTRTSDLHKFIGKCEDFYSSCFESSKYESLETDEEKLEYFEEKIDVRFDDSTNEYAICHHDGLSVFELESDTVEEAEIEAAEKINQITIGWFGSATVGEVTIIKEISENWYLLECDDCVREN